MKRRSVIPSLAMLAGCALVASGCGGAGGGSGPSTYVLGMTTDLSGPLVEYGPNQRQGAQTYIKYVNAHGGVNGHKIKLVVTDDKSDATAGLANVKQLVQRNHAIGILGLINSSVYAPAGRALKDMQVPAVGRAITGSLASESDSYSFSTAAPTELEAAPQAEFAAEKILKNKNATVAYMSIPTPAASEFVKNLQPAIKAKGWKVGAKQVAPLDSTDLTAEARSVASSHPGMVFCYLLDAQFTMFHKALRLAGYHGPMINVDFGSSYPTLKQLDDPKVYGERYFPYVPAKTSPDAEMATLQEAAKANNANPNTGFWQDGYTEAWIMVKALRKCGDNCEGPDLRKNLESLGTLDSKGLFVAPVEYSSSNRVGVKSVQVFHWDSAKKAPEAASDPLPLSNGS